MADYYRYVIIETYRYMGGGSKHSIRARPLANQGLPTTMRVECSSSMREAHAVGTKFKVWARIKDTAETPHLYTSWQWAYEVVTDAEAEVFIQKKFWGKR